MTLKVSYQNTFQTLKNIYPANEAEGITNLIFNELGYSRTKRAGSPELKLSSEKFDKLQKIVDELLKGAPLQYILGYTYFYDLKLEVNPSVLIPRPETEELTDLILKENPFKQLRVLDIGTGSGCIALTLASFLEEPEITALDISGNAINTARKNAQNLNLHLDLLQADVFHMPELGRSFDLIVSNPPYVRHSEKIEMKNHVTGHEPSLALFVPDEDPLVYYRAIKDVCVQYLVPGGRIYLEINEALGCETSSLFCMPEFSGTVLKKDLSGKNRFVKSLKNA